MSTIFRPTLANPSQKRTLRPIYAQHQATPYGGFLNPLWDSSFDIYPGTVMVRLSGEIFTPYDGTSGYKPFGLSALFKAPSLGIDETTSTGTNLFTVWVGGEQAVFEVLAPAFDQTANWAGIDVANGSRRMLTSTNKGLLTPTGANESNTVAELLSVEATDKILIRLNRFDPGPTSPFGAS